jgi:GT2 family glycosyltransferase
MSSQPEAEQPTIRSAVVAVIATFRRPKELERLLTSLTAAGPELRAAVIVDNANDPETESVVAAATINCRRIVPGKNLGCAGGLALGGRSAAEMFRDEYTHIWILDDDSVIPAGTLQCLLSTMSQENAWAAIPLVVDGDGRIGWFPHVLNRAQFNALRRRPMLAEFQQEFGSRPELFSWCTGVSLLIQRRAIEELGFHRADYWVRGEDLEYSLRLTSCGRGVLVPNAVVKHLPPSAFGMADRNQERAKHAAMLRNLAFTSFRLSHGKSLRWKLPGNWWRFLRTWGFTPASVVLIVKTFWSGAIKASPAGADLLQAE